MTVSADATRLAFVRKTGTPPVTPADPAFKVFRMTGESVADNNTFQSSNELDPSGQVRDAYVVDQSTSGAINFEVTDHTAFQEALAALFGADFTGSPSRLTPGTNLFLYLLEKRFDLGGGSYSFHRFDMSTFAELQLSISPGSPVSGVLNVAGGVKTRATSIITGATYPDPGTAEVLQPHKVVVTVGALTDTYTDVNLTLKNNVRDIKGVGTLGSLEKIRGRFEAEIKAPLYYKSDAVLTLIENQTEVAVSVQLKTLANVNAYLFEFPRCVIANGPVVAGGTGQDVLVDATIVAKYDAGAGYTCRVTRGV